VIETTTGAKNLPGRRKKKKKENEWASEIKARQGRRALSPFFFLFVGARHSIGESSIVAD